MADAKVPAFIFSSTAATFGEPERAPIDEDHPQRPINAYGETKLAIERALPHFERAYGIRSVALRYFNAAGADRTGSSARITSRRCTWSRAPSMRASAPAAVRSSATTTRRPTGPACATTSTSSISPTRTCWRWRTSRPAAHRAPTTSASAGRSRCGKSCWRWKRVAGQPVPHTMGPRRPGDPAVLYASADRIRRDLGWTPVYLDLRTIVDTAWQWRRRHPGGYSGGGAARSGA